METLVCILNILLLVLNDENIIHNVLKRYDKNHYIDTLQRSLVKFIIRLPSLIIAGW